MAFHRDELDILVHRYLQESGYQNSASTFKVEAGIPPSSIDCSLIPAGALINIVEKGILYTKSQISAGKNGSNQQLANSLSLIEAIMPAISTSRRNQNQQNPSVVMIEKQETSVNKGASTSTPAITSTDIKKFDNSIEIPEEKSIILKGHKSEAFTCAWNPITDLLASGSKDNTACIWDIADSSHSHSPLILRHCVKKQGIEVPSYKRVTTLDWNPDGTLLATGSYDSYARIWKNDGRLLSILDKHKGPVHALKWNKKGNFVLSAGVDNTTIIWDAASGDCIQQFAFHTAPVFDIDWQTNFNFASCSYDKCIHYCCLGIERPIKSFMGHTNAVNSIVWNPQGRLLASCSDDKTLKIWAVNRDTCVCNLQGHTSVIDSIKWSPTGPGTANPNMNLTLASASFDSTIRLWDVEHSTCLHTLTKHIDRVNSVDFSPDGKFLASGGNDKFIHIWSTQSGQLVHRYKCTSGIFKVDWHSKSDKICASGLDGNVYVLDLQKL